MSSSELLSTTCEGSTEINYAHVRRLAKEAFGFDSGDTLLTIEEESVLISAIQKGNQSNDDEVLQKATLAKECLVISNLPFVGHIVKKSMGRKPPVLGMPNGTYRGLHHSKNPLAEYDDRFQAGVIGLMRAADNVQPATPGAKSTKFITYAAWSIQNAIDRHSISEEWSGFRLPEHIATMINTTYNFERTQEPEMDNQLAKWHVGRMATSLELVISDEPKVDGDSEDGILRLEDIMPDSQSHQEHEVLFDQLKMHIEIMLSTLSERESGIIRLRFGLEDGDYHTLDEIAHIYGVSRERIRQIESKTLSKLRGPLRAKYLYLHEEEGILGGFILPDELSALPNLRGDSYVFDRVSASGGTMETAYELRRANDLALENEREELESWQIYKDEPWELLVHEDVREQTVVLRAERIEQAKKYLLPQWRISLILCS